MRNGWSSESARFVHVRLELDESLGALAEPPRAAELEESVRAELARELRRAGLDADPTVVVTGARDSRRAVRVFVHGTAIPFRAGLPGQLWRALAPENMLALPDTGSIHPDETFPDGWLRSYVGASPADDPLALALVSALSVEAIKECAGCLVSEALADAYRRSLFALAPPTLERSEITMRALLDLGVSLRDRERILEAIAEAEADVRPAEEGIERAFDTVRAPQLDLLLSQADASRHASELEPALAQAPEALFGLLGVRAPGVRMVSSDDVRDGVLRLRVNDRLRAPLRFAPPGEDPSTGTIVESVVSELVAAAPRLLAASDVELSLAHLEMTHPVLVRTTLARYSLEELTAALRRLLVEAVSVRGLRGILERLITFASVTADPSAEYVLADAVPLLVPPASRRHRPAVLAEFIRSEFPPVAPGIDPGPLVRWIRANRELDEWAAHQASADHGDSLEPRRQEAILDAFWTHLRGGDPTRTTVVLTSPGARAPLRDLLGREVAGVRVLAETDLRPGTIVEDADVLPLR